MNALKPRSTVFMSRTDLSKVIAYLSDSARLCEALPMQSMKSRAHMIRALVAKIKDANKL